MYAFDSKMPPGHYRWYACLSLFPLQVWLLWNAAVHSLVIAFRGTEQVKWKDMVTDLSFQPAPFNPERVLERSYSASLIKEEVCSTALC